MKKLLASILIATLSLSMLAACGSTSEATSTSTAPESTSTSASTEAPTEEVTELVYWQHSSAARDEMITKLLAEFEAANPDIKVTTEFIPFADYMTKLIPALATDNAPDVFQIQSGMVAKLAEAGSIQPLDESVMSVDTLKNDFIASTIDGMSYDGVVYGVPTDTQTIIAFWNTELVKAAGLDAEKGPQTWDEFFDWARALTQKDADGNLVVAGWGCSGYWPELVSYIEQMGGKFYDAEANQFVFADDATAIEAFKSYSALYTEDKVYNTEFTATWAGFRLGQVGMMLGHPAMMGNLPVTAPDLDFSVSAIPANGDSHATAVTSWGYVPSAKAPSEAATRLIEFLSSQEVQKQWTLTTGELPSRKALLEDADLLADPKLVVALDSLNDSFVGPLQTGAFNTLFGEMYERIIKTDDAIEDILA